MNRENVKPVVEISKSKEQHKIEQKKLCVKYISAYIKTKSTRGK